MGLYLSNRFLALTPDFVHQFNANISSCAVSTLRLSEQEEARIRTQVDQLVTPLLASDSLRALLIQSNQRNRKLDMAAIHQADVKWMAASDEGRQPAWI